MGFISQTPYTHKQGFAWSRVFQQEPNLCLGSLTLLYWSSMISAQAEDKCLCLSICRWEFFFFLHFVVCVPAFLCTCACMHAKCACVISHAGMCGGSHAFLRAYVCVCVQTSEQACGAASVSDRTAEVMLRLG